MYIARIDLKCSENIFLIVIKMRGENVVLQSGFLGNLRETYFVFISRKYFSDVLFMLIEFEIFHIN